MFPRASTKRVVSILAIITVALLVVYGGLYYWLNRQAQAAQQTAAKIRQKKNATQRSQSLRTLVNDTRSSRNIIDEMFIQPDGAAQFISTIEQLAKDTDVQLNLGNVSLQEDSASSMFSQLQMQLQVQGSWGSVTHFVRQLELLPHSKRIQSVSFSRSRNEATDTVSWQATMTITADKLTQS